MIDWAKLTLFLFIVMRMSGFVLFSPLFGRNGIPGIVRSGLILVLSVFVASTTDAVAVIPDAWLDLLVRLCLELALGYILGLVMNFFFSVPILAGEAIDTQMGMTMAKTYDAGSQASISISANLINILMVLLFFAANGHQTLLRILLTSGDLVPFGAVSIGTDLIQHMLELFVESVLLSVKLCLPVLAAELIGQVGMGILMKAIPQINVFSINLELKIILGLVMMYLLISPFSDFLLNMETTMLSQLRFVLSLAG